MVLVSMRAVFSLLALLFCYVAAGLYCCLQFVPVTGLLLFAGVVSFWFGAGIFVLACEVPVCMHWALL